MVSDLFPGSVFKDLFGEGGAGAADVQLSLANDTSSRVDPLVEIVVTTELGTPEVRVDAGAWESWSSGMLFDDITYVDSLSDLAGSYLLEARANSDDLTIVGKTVTVPTFVEKTSGTQYLKAAGTYYIK